jgi:hypothetical protein
VLGVAVVGPRQVAGDVGGYLAKDLGELGVVDEGVHAFPLSDLRELGLGEPGVHE